MVKLFRNQIKLIQLKKHCNGSRRYLKTAFCMPRLYDVSNSTNVSHPFNIVVKKLEILFPRTFYLNKHKQASTIKRLENSNTYHANIVIRKSSDMQLIVLYMLKLFDHILNYLCRIKYKISCSIPRIVHV